jgi:hypothetical protein
MYKLKFDAKDTIRHLKKLSDEVGLTVRELCYEQKRLWLNDLIKKTPPKTLSVGRQAVANDVNKIFKAVNNPTVLEVWEDELRAGGYEIDRKLKSGKTVIAKKQLKAQSRAAVADIHARHRIRRGKLAGRVKFKYDSKRIWGGKWLVPKQAINAEIKEKQRHVGKLKAGWLPAAQYYAAKAHGPVKAPGFVKRHGGQFGRYRDTMGKSGSGDMVSTNAVSWAGANAYLKNWIAFTQRARQRDILRHARKRLDQLERRFNALERVA